MRRFAVVCASGVALIALASSGCTQQEAEVAKVVIEEVSRELCNEIFRVEYTAELGPMIVTSIVGASAPPGPAALNALCTDHAWRMLVATRLPGVAKVPLMLEGPDPNHPVKIRALSNTRPLSDEGK